MTQAHAAGVPFDQAWTRALREATHGARYVDALGETRDAWARAYRGDPPTRGEAAASELVAWLLDDGEDVGAYPDRAPGGRSCPIPCPVAFTRHNRTRVGQRKTPRFQGVS